VVRRYSVAPACRSRPCWFSWESLPFPGSCPSARWKSLAQRLLEKGIRRKLKNSLKELAGKGNGELLFGAERLRFEPVLSQRGKKTSGPEPICG
jgi:hypothetical protein